MTAQKSSFAVPLAKPCLDKEMEEAAINALRNEKYVMGESVFKFEEEFAKYCGTSHAVSTSSGSNALQIALLAMGVKPGFQAVVPAMSFIASANCVVHAGGEPTFVDIDPNKYTIDVSGIEVALTERCQVLLPVHLYGMPADMNEILEIAARKRVWVLEDAAQAHGADYWSRKVGSIGDAACFSFYSTKNMTVCGDGGMITTSDSRMARMAAKLRDCGRVSHYIHDMIGYTSRLNTVNAAIGRVQLRRLDEWVQKRRELAEKYHGRLKEVEEVRLPPSVSRDIKPAYHLYVIRARHRNQLKKWLESAGIECGVHYPEPIPLQPVYRAASFSRHNFPVSEQLANEALSLPMYPDLNTSQVDHVCETVEEFYS